MDRVTDEILIAYADGRLPAEEAAAVETHLAGDSEARQFVAALKTSADLARAAFDGHMRQSTLASLADLIMSAPPHPAQQGNIIAIPSRPSARSNRRPDRNVWKPIAMAASMALVLGLGAGFLIGKGSGGAAISEFVLGEVKAKGVLHGALERRAMGEVIALPTESGRLRQNLSVLATFHDRLDRPCREIEILTDTPDPRPLAAAVACRDSDGRWIVEGATRVATSDAGSGDGTFYPSGIREKDAIEVLLNLLGASKALSEKEERELIARGWQK